MKILVVDVAAEHGGALSILKEFIAKFRKDKDNKYTVCVSNLDFEDSENVKFVKIPWVKRSRAHRIYFDSFYIKKLIKKYSPDKLFSLQNKGFSVKKLPQDVYFHNALFICEKRFTLRESRGLWVYQNLISMLTKKSLKFADRIIVQAEWIKRGLSLKWNIPETKIIVERPGVNPIFASAFDDAESKSLNLFYPANFSPYKNHRTLFSACIKLWKKNGTDAFTLTLTGSKDALPASLAQMIGEDKFPISFLGRLSPEEMKTEYCRSALVFPSYIETVGLPLMEAKSLNIPIISADCEYAKESAGNGENVRYFNPFNAEELSQRIEELIAAGKPGEETC